MRVEPERLNRLLLAAAKLSTKVPVAEPCLISMLPMPFCIASLKVNTMFLSTATPVAPSTGPKVDTAGAVVSKTVEVEKIPSANLKFSTSETISIASRFPNKSATVNAFESKS